MHGQKYIKLRPIYLKLCVVLSCILHSLTDTNEYQSIQQHRSNT